MRQDWDDARTAFSGIVQRRAREPGYPQVDESQEVLPADEHTEAKHYFEPMASTCHWKEAAAVRWKVEKSSPDVVLLAAAGEALDEREVAVLGAVVPVDTALEESVDPLETVRALCAAEVVGVLAGLDIGVVEVGFAGVVRAAGAVGAVVAVKVVPAAAEADGPSDRRGSSAVAASEDFEDRLVGFRPSCRRQRVAEVQDLVEAGSASAHPIEGQVGLLQERRVDKLEDEHLAVVVRRLGLVDHLLADLSAKPAEP